MKLFCFSGTTKREISHKINKTCNRFPDPLQTEKQRITKAHDLNFNVIFNKRRSKHALKILLFGDAFRVQNKSRSF